MIAYETNTTPLIKRTIMNRSNRLRVTLLGVAVCVGLLAGSALALPRIAVGGSSPNRGVTVTNVSDQSFSVTWTTQTRETGSSIKFGTSCATATGSASEMTSNGQAHLVNAPAGLAPATTYYFKVVAGGSTDDNQGNCYKATTFKRQSVPPPPSAAIGLIKSAHCAAGLSGGVVTLTVTHKGVASLPLATISGSGGAWALPYADAANGSGTFVAPAKGDKITYTEFAGSGKPAHASVTYNGKAQILSVHKLCA